MRNLAFYALALLACLRTSPIYSQAPASDGALYTLDELHSLLDFTARATSGSGGFAARLPNTTRPPISCVMTLKNPPFLPS